MKKMKIVFQIKTNMNSGSVPMINTLKVLFGAAGFIIDRDETEIEPTFEGQSDVYTITWKHCYVWDGKTARYELTNEEIDALCGDADAEFEIEDEAPEDEYYEILDMHIVL